MQVLRNPVEINTKHRGVTKIARFIPDDGPEEDSILEVASGLELEERAYFRQEAATQWEE